MPAALRPRSFEGAGPTALPAADRLLFNTQKTAAGIQPLINLAAFSGDGNAKLLEEADYRQSPAPL